MQDTISKADQAKWAEWRAVANLYHAFFTGLILTVVTRRGAAAAEELVFRVFPQTAGGALSRRARQARPKQAPSRRRGRPVSLPVELDRRCLRRVHVRERPQGLDPLSAAAVDLAGHGDLRHSDGGLARDAARLARQQRRGAEEPEARFVRTKQTVDVLDGLEGYYYEHDRDLAVDERLQFARHLEAYAIRPGRAPGAAGQLLAAAPAGKGVPQLRDGIRADRGASTGAAVRP